MLRDMGLSIPPNGRQKNTVRPASQLGVGHRNKLRSFVRQMRKKDEELDFRGPHFTDEYSCE